MMTRLTLSSIGMALLTACQAPHGICDGFVIEETPEPIEAPGWRSPSGPCALDPTDPKRLVVTTTDFSTGAITEVDLVHREVRADLASSSTDAIPAWSDGRVHVIHRFGWDFVEVFDPATWRTLGQYPVGEAGRANPQAVVAGPDGLALVTLLGAPWVEVLDLQATPDRALVDRIDLTAFADADGNPEAGPAVACGDTMYVAIARLDPQFRRVDHDALVAIDMHARKPLPGTLKVRGALIRQLRRARTDPQGKTLLALTTGIERIDLATQTVEWAVSAEAFAEAGIDHLHLPQAFDVSDDGTMAYMAAYGPDDDQASCGCSAAGCFEQVRLYRVGLDGREPRVPEPFAGGFDSVAQTLEVVDDVLWYGSTRVDAPGLWAFDLKENPPLLLDGPLSTGLPPYALVATP